MEEKLENFINQEFEWRARGLLEIEEEPDSTKRKRLKVEEHEFAKRRMLIGMKSIMKDGNKPSSSLRSMKLVFRNGISRTILPGQVIKGQDNTTPIEVALIDDSTGQVVKVEPECSMVVEIIVLKGEFEGEDWTAQAFNDNIVSEMEGKRPFRAENIRVKLQQGIGILDDIKLRHHMSKIKPPSFRLGARAVDEFDVKEAKTEPFIVKNYRSKYFEKSETPLMSDKVCRLTNIQKGGVIHKRLESNNICTVEDFLIRLLIYPESLKSIVNLGAKKWDAAVNNARACPDYRRMHCYINTMLSENNKA